MTLGNKITSDEAIALSTRFNLADGHARQLPLLLTSGLDVGEIASEAYGLSQGDSDGAGFAAYVGMVGGSRFANHRWRPFYSSSLATELVAHVLIAHERVRTLVLCPTFDNIPDILRRVGHEVIASHADQFSAGIIDAELLIEDALRYNVDAVFVVSPNNPTGSLLDPASLKRLATELGVAGIVLVVDTSFRGFDERACFDYEAILRNSTEHYMVIDDTGKLLPLLELKLAYLSYSEDLVTAVESIYDDMILNVSSFVSVLLRRCCEGAAGRSTLAGVRSVIRHNRRVLRDSLELPELAQIMSIPCPHSMASVESLSVQVPHGPRELVLSIQDRWSVSLLSLESFCWDGCASIAGVRVALSREASYFDIAWSRVIETIREIG